MTLPPRRKTGATTFGWVGAALLGAVGIGSVWSGCTVTKENYKTLSFFFDGVPDPSLPKGFVAGFPGGDGTPVFVVVHKPYAEEKCDTCHTTRYRPSRNDSSICLQCHGSVQTEYPNMHGPVVATACLWCHNPHESTRPALLRDPDRKLCMQCHTAENLDVTRIPAHADEARACLECHSGHGSHGRFMLKPGEASSPAPGAPPEKQ